MMEWVAAGVARRADGAVLCQKRPEGSFYGGYYEFPGGKLELMESAEAALVREFREELGVRVLPGPRIHTAYHDYGERQVVVHFLHCRMLGEPRPREGQEIAFVPPEKLSEYPFLPADGALIAMLPGLPPPPMPNELTLVLGDGTALEYAKNLMEAMEAGGRTAALMPLEEGAAPIRRLLDQGLPVIAVGSLPGVERLALPHSFGGDGPGPGGPVPFGFGPAFSDPAEAAGELAPLAMAIFKVTLGVAVKLG
jgi:8-oxo-dGTP diphosphatase